MTTLQGSEWSDAELEATVQAYLEMLRLQRVGQSFVKAHYNRILREGALAGRSKGSVEFRMQNISAVLNQLCLKWIDGYPPRGNVGTSTREKILGYLDADGLLDSQTYAPSANEDELNAKVAQLSQLELSGTPIGIEKPARIARESYGFARDPLVKAWVLKQAKGHCESCGEPAPFRQQNGLPFLEVHHVRPLADGGSDRGSNAVALCPNCHRRCHLSEDKDEFVSALHQKVGRLVAE